MASSLAGLRRMCVLAAVVASVAGCVGMPSNGPTQEFSASPASAEPDGNLIGPFPSGPRPGADPSNIVQGFLIASASYPTYTVAQQYLVAAAVKTWHPGFAVTVFSKLVPASAPVPKASPGAVQQALVTVTGPVEARFDGAGQYVSAQNQDQASSPYKFKLVMVDGQWRITNPPDYRMLTADDFPLFYKAQDLYFFGPQNPALVPDSVFVPLGATVSQLLDTLVKALAEGPTDPWLVGAAGTELPSDIKVQDVDVNGSAVAVDLAGHASKADRKQLGRFAAQLVWTLIGSRTSPPAIQSVIVNLNGQPWSPSTAPCPGGPNPGPFQTQAAYQCFDPYPSSPASFYYVDRGQLWSRCGSESLGLQGNIGAVVPVVDHTGVFSSTQQCVLGNAVHEGYVGAPAAQPQSLPAASLASVSPDGKYLAIASAGNGNLYVGPLSGPASSFLTAPRLTGANITALSWDRSDDLWAVSNGDIVMLPAGGKTVVQVGFDGMVNDLSVAPDGVRIAFTAVPNGSAKTGLYLAAIGGGQQVNNGDLGPPNTHEFIRAYASLGGPSLARPTSITWYDADDLIALNQADSGNTLWEVPIDGQPASELQVAPRGVTSIAAGGAANVLVAGLSGHQLEVSTSLEGPWYPIGDPGQNPAYPG